MTDKSASTITPKLLTPKEAASQLGVAPVTIRLWAQEQKLPFITTIGGHRRFHQADIDAFIAQQMSVPSTKLNVLIVDDNEPHAEYLAEYIRRTNPEFSIFIALDGFEAGQLIYEIKPDLILLDLVMPGMDGYSVCQRIKENPSTSSIRVIAMTGYSTPKNIKRVLAAGAEVCLNKPIDKLLLNEILQQSSNIK